MRLALYTARLSCRDPDCIDIARGGCDRARAAGKPTPGEFLAPSAALVFPTLRALKAAASIEAKDLVFATYAAAYRIEMLSSYASRRGEWNALLGQARAVLTCFCTEPERCHRTLASGFLAKLGAKYRGEIA